MAAYFFIADVFLADRAIGRAYATVLRPSVCRRCYEQIQVVVEFMTAFADILINLNLLSVYLGLLFRPTISLYAFLHYTIFTIYRFFFSVSKIVHKTNWSVVPVEMEWGFSGGGEWVEASQRVRDWSRFRARADL